jgi:hypothetical protein
MVFLRKNSTAIAFTGLMSIVFFASLASATTLSKQQQHDLWLKQTFGAQHQQLIPVVAVADMFFACDQQSQQPQGFSLDHLVREMNKDMLAEKLLACLDGQSLTSDGAINFGLLGCFQDQLAGLPLAEQQQKMALVSQSFKRLSRQQRQQSLTKCVTTQAISYLE